MMWRASLKYKHEQQHWYANSWSRNFIMCLWHRSFCYAFSVGSENSHRDTSYHSFEEEGELDKNQIDDVYNYYYYSYIHNASAGQNFKHCWLLQQRTVTIYIYIHCVLYAVYVRIYKNTKVLNENKRRWMEQKTTVKHDNVKSNQRWQKKIETRNRAAEKPIFLRWLLFCGVFALLSDVKSKSG